MQFSNRAAGAVVVLCLLAAGVALPVFSADEIERHTTLALTYREGDGTRVDMVGVSPRSGLLGQAEVKRKDGRTRIKLDMEALPYPLSLGPLYTTYVLWAVAPEGRAENLAELPQSKSFTIDATTALPSFGLIVTAEPHAAVTRPGPRPVAENALRDDTKGRVQTGRVAYEVTPEREAAPLGRPDHNAPLLLLGARRAVEMARSAGAAEYAEPELREAEVKLAALEQLSPRKEKLSKEQEMVARDVMRLAEHARTLAADRRDEALRAAERRAARSAVARAQADADDARRQAERQREESAEEAALARRRVEASRAEAERARAAEERARTTADQALANEERARSSEEQARAEAERARLQAQQAERDRAAAERDRADVQEQLFRSLSAILDTRREARGLIVSLSDVLFDFDRASLKPGAREKLSKLAGILLAYPGPYHMEIEGHTDAVGSQAYNKNLSEDRAQSVRDYLVDAGVPQEKIVRVAGFGKTRPVASNDTAAGRQMNRRVELVITDLHE
jgi:outer membrane protein OmpA-like peptidoglycan-associated protein